MPILVCWLVFSIVISLPYNFDDEPKFMCNKCHEHFIRQDMDFDDDQDLCKNCNYVSYNDAPYGQD